MAVKPPTPKWQTVTLFFAGLTIMGYETLSNSTNYAVVGAALGMMGLGPVLNRSSSRKGQHDNDDADAH